jgi:hypothetical protein
LETATTRDWEPLRTNVNLGDVDLRYWLLAALLVSLVCFLVAKFCT